MANLVTYSEHLMFSLLRTCSLASMFNFRLSGCGKNKLVTSSETTDFAEQENLLVVFIIHWNKHVTQFNKTGVMI